VVEVAGIRKVDNSKYLDKNMAMNKPEVRKMEMARIK
jgi:hypothetical protein